MNKSTRETALDILLETEKNNKYLSSVLSGVLRANQFISKHDRAFIGRLSEGVTEQKIRLDYILNLFSKTEMKKCRPLIRCVLRMAVYEIFYMDSVPDEVSCNEYVNLAAKRGFKSLKGYVNGVLRSVCRNKDAISYPDKKDGLEKYFSVKYSVPEDLVHFLMKDYDENRLEVILGAKCDNKTTIRVNTDITDVNEFANKLTNNGINVEKGKYNKTSLIISDYDSIRSVPGFHDGCFTVQDESSSLSVLSAGIKPGDLVIDVCAAPGGKTMYAAELAGNAGRVIAEDISEDKIELIEENVERLKLSNVICRTHDARKTSEKLTGKADVVICDLPCSGLGVMGRKNDIKYHVNEETVKELAELQRSILNASAAYVKPSGVMIYSTCTIDSIENEDNLFWFLENHEDFYLDGFEKYVPDSLKDRAKKGYMTLLQGYDGCDGFFISKLKRKNI